MRKRRIGVNQSGELSREENELVGCKEVQARKVVSKLENVIRPVIEGGLENKTKYNLYKSRTQSMCIQIFLNNNSLQL